MKVGIIGGGITGLTTALALQKEGISSIVYEQASELNEVGSGIWLQPNAIKVLDWLEVKDEIKRQGKEIDKMEITNNQLIPFKRMKSEIVQDEEGNKTIAIHRAKLQRILLNEVQKLNKVHINKKYESHFLDAEAINLQFEDGTDKVDVLLGADGIYSSVRKVLFPNSSVRNSGQVCWRGISKMALPNSLKNLGQEAWGKQIRFGFSQINDGEVYWFAVANNKYFLKSDEIDIKQHIIELFHEFSPVVAELIRNTETHKIHQTTLQDLKRLTTWHSNKICLIGDAAHATTPNMGQGACQGIEDAYYISKSLSRSIDNPAAAFQDFDKKRRKKVDYIVNNSWQFGKIAHSSLGQPLMKLMLKMTPESRIKKQMNKLYAIDA